MCRDFSENYSVIIQDAKQSQYWSKEQITLHPFVVYYVDGDKLEHECFIVISKDLNHNSNAVNLFINKLITELKTKHSIKKMIYIIDGAAAQYKNKSNFINLAYNYSDY